MSELTLKYKKIQTWNLRWLYRC